MHSFLLLRHTFLSMILFVSLCIAGAKEHQKQQHRSSNRGTMMIADGIVIVKLKLSASLAPQRTSFGISSLDEILARIDVRSIRPFSISNGLQKASALEQEFGLDRLYVIHFTLSEQPELLARELTQNPIVEYAEPYYVFPLDHTPNDPQIGQQWAISMMKMFDAWDITTGDSTIVIGDVDSGIDWTHPDLEPSISINSGEWGVNGSLSKNGIDDDGNGLIDDWHGWDYIGNGTAQNPQPDNNPADATIGHGTNTAGCAAAVTNNGVGIAGTSYRSKVLPIKAGDGAGQSIIAGYDGIKYAADMGCKVINCSWGGTGAFSQALQDIINYANAKGALVVSSSGNNPLDNDVIPHTPSSYQHVLNVGSIETNGSASTWCTYGTSVHVYAPGNSIYTTRNGGGYTNPTGTSFSSPLTAGVAALVFSVHPNWKPDQVAKQLRVTADAFTNPSQAKRFGRINALKAVSLNNSLSDIPGIQIKSFSATTPGGTSFTEGGQTARVNIVLENVLAPTSGLATATVEFDDALVSSTTSVIPLGIMPTFGTQTISFDVILMENPTLSEGWVPVRLRITDGNYTDFLLGRIAIYITEGWHSSASVGLPYFSSVNVLNASTVWATADVSQQQDYCFRTTNSGTNWYNASGAGFPTGQGVFCISALGSSSALIGTGPSNGNAQIAKTNDGGQTWAGTSVSNITGFVNFIHMFDATNGIFQGDPKGGRWGLGKTVDGGSTWSAITTPVSAGTSEAGWNNAYDAVGNTVWFGTNSSKLYKSTDAGDTWVSYQTPSMHSPDVSFRDEQVGVVRFSVQNNTGTNAMARTSDGGTTWQLITSMQMTATGQISMEKNGKRLWLLRDGNAYVSTDVGDSWSLQPAPGDFNPITVSDAWSSTTTTYVYAAGSSIYKFVAPFQPVGGTPVQPVFNVASFDVGQAYPNPVSLSAAGTFFTFTTGQMERLRLDVFDNSGKSVTTVFDAVLTAGMHSVRIPTALLTPGVYHCRFTGGNTTVMRSFVLMF